MGNAFEEARHQGYSAEEMAADEEEATKRMEELGCPSCRYKVSYKICNTIIEGDYDRCPYIKAMEV